MKIATAIMVFLALGVTGYPTIDQSKTIDPEINPLMLDEMLEHERQGARSLFQLSVLGVKETNTLALISHLRSRNSLDWEKLESKVIQLEESRGYSILTGAIMARLNDVVPRHRFDITLPGELKWRVEVAQGGAQISLASPIRADRVEPVLVALYFLRSHDVSEYAKKSNWQIRYKASIFDDFTGETKTGEAIQRIDRKSPDDQIWLRLEPGKISLWTGYRVTDTQGKPDAVLDANAFTITRVDSSTIKRVN